MQEPMSGPEPEAPAGSEGPAVTVEHGVAGEHAGDAEPDESGQPSEPDESGESAEHAVAAGSAVTAGSPEPVGPQPLGIMITPTGDATVDARLRRLADADHLPANGHLEVYEDVHRGLRDALAALDQRPGPPAPVRDDA